MTHREYVRKRLSEIPRELSAKLAEAASARRDHRDRVKTEISKLEKTLARFQAEQAGSRERFQSLPDRARRLHDRAFTTNSRDPDFRTLTTLNYRGGDIDRHMLAPKGDVLHQFRKDVGEVRTAIRRPHDRLGLGDSAIRELARHSRSIRRGRPSAEWSSSSSIRERRQGNRQRAPNVRSGGEILSDQPNVWRTDSAADANPSRCSNPTTVCW